ncbi:hypothetical protein D3C72_66530 [compost metagenome]
MPRARKYANDAERVAAFRKRHGLVSVSLDLPQDLVDALDDFMKFKDLTRSKVVAKLIRSQLLRKR